MYASLNPDKAYLMSFPTDHNYFLEKDIQGATASYNLHSGVCIETTNGGYWENISVLPETAGVVLFVNLIVMNEKDRVNQ